MNHNAHFKEYVMGDLFAEMQGVTVRAMFGGYGIYKNSVFFAIIVDGKLFFKVGDSNRKEYEEHGIKPFTYKMPNGKPYQMSYWQVPEEIMENREVFSSWVSKAVIASLTAKKMKPKPVKK